MSRISRYINENEINKKKAQWNVALYLRLSRCDDEDEYKDES